MSSTINLNCGLTLFSPLPPYLRNLSLPLPLAHLTVNEVEKAGSVEPRRVTVAMRRERMGVGLPHINSNDCYGFSAKKQK